MAYDAELKTALQAARAAGEIQRSCKTKELNIAIKKDSSPVTDVDRLCESAMRDIIEKQFPADGFLGEETGKSAGTSGRTWIVDPLDGTRPYIRGIPTHSALIALQDGEDLVVGCMFLSSLGESYWAARGGGAFLNGEPICVSKTDRLGNAFGSGFGFIQKPDAPEGKALVSLMRSWDYAYGFMDAYSYGGVAAGRLDLCVNLCDMPWDCAAAACIVTEAGGRFSDIHGAASIYNGTVVLSNGLVHEAVLEYFHRT
jgi:histidinol-phosphatase